MANGTQNPEVSRRTFLAQTIGTCVAFLATLIGIPAAGAAVGPSLRRTEPGWIDLGKLEIFPEGVPKAVQFPISRRDGYLETSDVKGVWVLRQGADVTVFNGRCTHLGCAVNWQPDKNRFFSPCHDGVFARDGQVLDGPPPRSLDPLPTRIEDGSLFVQYVDFLLGIAERVPL